MIVTHIGEMWCGAVRSGAGAISHTSQLYACELLSIACMRICAFTLEIAHFSNVHVHIHIYPILMFAFTFTFTFVFKYVLCALFCFVTYSPFVWMFFDHIRSFAVAVAAFFSFIYFCQIPYFCMYSLTQPKSWNSERGKRWWKEQYCLRNRIENMLDTAMWVCVCVRECVQFMWMFM